MVIILNVLSQGYINSKTSSIIMGNLQNNSLTNYSHSLIISKRHRNSLPPLPTKPNSPVVSLKIEPIFVLDEEPQPEDLEPEDSYQAERTIEEVRVKWSSFIKIREGDYLQEYVVMRELGRGGYGSVYKVKGKYSNIIRAAKKIKKAELTVKEQERLFNEVSILQSLDHPNIIKLYEVYEQQDLYVLIMEICEGGELFKKISRRELRTREAARITRQLLEAITYIHSKNIVHRDIKPENILFDKQTKNIKLIDFGIAQRKKPQDYLTARIGTIYYIAPEVLLKKYDEKCDVWSAGVVLYMMLFGKPPFVGNDDYEIMQAILKDEAEFQGRSWMDLPKSCKELLVDMLQKNPKTRLNARDTLENMWLSNEETSASKKDIMHNSAQNMAQFGFKNRLQAVVYTYCISQLLSKSQKDGLESVFKKCDTDYDGVISLDEFKTIMKEHVKDEKRLKTIMRLIDLDGSGNIEYTEFLVGVTNHQEQLKLEHYEKAFDYFDIDHSGGIGYQEVAKFLQGSEAGEKIKQIFEEIDCNGDGNISREQFVALFIKQATRSIKQIKQLDEIKKGENSLHISTKSSVKSSVKSSAKSSGKNRSKRNLRG